ncbi:Predicted arabinose efflux permease, MFS family [Georgfuchsia toluolica]|uniref:Predicted arabinose efflux permease, MFS family n=1 Tax=Georgfuchsia toluolica TaxID=424218 RepID=A0A916MYW5_9PROT|nr:MFS transporter [Georgfuchsia toluolica]CAG4882289.1 Predicted arabinose efflux permease, MFS family [Georgfuchsia toluolica]
MPKALDKELLNQETEQPVLHPSVAQKLVVVCGAALGLSCGFGPMFFSVTGIFLKPMASSFSWGRADVALLPMLGMVGVAVGAPIMGQIADRVGWRKVIGYSIFLFSLALLTLAMAPPSRAYLAAVGFAGGVLGAATTAAGYLAILPRVFDRRFGMALGFGMLGSGLGGVAAPILANALIGIMGWRQAYAVLALIALLLGAFAHQMIFRTLHHIESAPDSVKTRRSLPESIAIGDGLTLSQALATYQFWLIAVVIFLVSCVILGGYIHLAPFASDKGMSSEYAAKAMALAGLGLAVSRVAIGAVLDLVFAPLVGLIAFILGAAGFAMLAYAPADIPGLLMLSALLLGISTGTEGDLIPFLARKYFGQKSFGSIYGTLFGIATMGGAVGPYVYGLAFDEAKTYTLIHEVSALVCGICGLVILLMGPYRYGRSGAGHCVVDEETR